MRTSRFSGTIIPVVLEIWDHKTLETIKTDKLFLHTEFENSEYKLTGLIPEGCFQATVKSLNEIRRLDDFEETQWVEAVDSLLHDTYEGKLVLKAKFVSSQNYYDEEGKLKDDDELELIDEYVTLEITEHGKLAKIYGSVQLSLQEDDSDEQDMFNWLDFLANRSKSATLEQREAATRIGVLERENSLLKQTLDKNSDLHKKIISDLENKFYQLLESKKQRIMELEANLGHELEGLNEVYVEKNKLNLNKIAINKDDIPDKLDERYIRKLPRKNTKTKKRRLLRDLDAEESEPEQEPVPKTKSVKLERKSASKPTPNTENATKAKRTMSKLTDKQLTSEILGSESGSEPSAHEDTQVSEMDSESNSENSEPEQLESKSEAQDTMTNKKSKEESQPEISLAKSGADNGDQLNRETVNDQFRPDRSFVSDLLNETDYSSD